MQGLRKYRKLYLETAKGSGKSPLAAALGLWCLFADGESGAQVYVVAKNSHQAEVLFKYAVGMFERAEHLTELGYVYGGATNPQRIVSRGASGGFMRRVAQADKGFGVSGPLPSCILFDEVHEVSDFTIIELLEAGVKHRQQPLTVFTTNAGAGTDTPAYREHSYALQVASGVLDDPEYLALVYSVDPGDEPLTDNTCWSKANPSLPDIPGRSYINAAVRKCRGLPAKQSEVMRLNFSQWTEALDPWIDIEAWKACEREELSDVEERAQVPCYLGLDLAMRNDLTAGVAAWDFGDRVEVEARIWVPEDGLAHRASRDGAPYDLWVEQGFMQATPGRIVDYAIVFDWLIAHCSRGDVRMLVFDRWGVNELMLKLDQANIAYRQLRDDRRRELGGLYVSDHPQGFYIPNDKPVGELWLAMPRSISHAEALILQNELHAKVNPALRSAVLGAVPVTDGSRNRRFMKNKALTRIDACVAMVMAIGAAIDVRERDWADISFDEVAGL